MNTKRLGFLLSVAVFFAVVFAAMLNVSAVEMVGPIQNSPIKVEPAVVSTLAYSTGASDSTDGTSLYSADTLHDTFRKLVSANATSPDTSVFASDVWNSLDNSCHTLASLSALPYGINGTLVVSYDKGTNSEFLFLINGGNNSNTLVSITGLYFGEIKSDGTLWASDLNNDWSQIETTGPLLPSNFSGAWTLVDNTDHTLASLSALPYGIDGTLVIAYDKKCPNDELLFFINSGNNLVSIGGLYLFEIKSDGSLWASDLNNNWSQIGIMGPLLPSNFPPKTSCTYTLSSASQSFDSTGGTGSVGVTTSNGCNWTATSNNPDWITISSGSSGSGKGNVNYVVTANTSASQKTGTITIAGQTLTVTQSGNSVGRLSITITSATCVQTGGVCDPAASCYCNAEFRLSVAGSVCGPVGSSTTLGGWQSLNCGSWPMPNGWCERDQASEPSCTDWSVSSLNDSGAAAGSKYVGNVTVYGNPDTTSSSAQWSVTCPQCKCLSQCVPL